jgi:hypothetical protein
LRLGWLPGAQGTGDLTPSNGALAGDGMISLETDPASVSGNGAQIAREIQLPQGSVITGWRALAQFDQGGLGNVSAQCALKKAAHDFTTPALDSTATVGSNQTHTDTGGAVHVFQQSGLSETVDASEQFWLFCSITSSAGYRQALGLYGIEVTYTEARASGSH